VTEHLCMVQIIAAREYGIYALDENGAVWHFGERSGWTKLPMPSRPEPPGPPAAQREPPPHAAHGPGIFWSTCDGCMFEKLGCLPGWLK
jgi:hypothetical protein